MSPEGSSENRRAAQFGVTKKSVFIGRIAERKYTIIGEDFDQLGRMSPQFWEGIEVEV